VTGGATTRFLSWNIRRQRKIPNNPSFYYTQVLRYSGGIFEPWDWVYFQALPSWAWAEIYQKLIYLFIIAASKKVDFTIIFIVGL
jgi:hypothetical protein